MTKKRRSLAAKKGWKTRRARALARSQAAKRGAVTRKAKRERREHRTKERAERIHAARREQARLHRLREPDLDYFEEMSDDFDIDISDLYDMYYGYEPRGVA